MSFFDNHSDWFQQASACEAKWCISHFSHPPTHTTTSITSGSPPTLPSVFLLSRSPPLSAAWRSPPKQQSRRLAQTASVSTNPPRDRQEKKWVRVRKMKRAEKEGSKKDMENEGTAPTSRSLGAQRESIVHKFSISKCANDSRWRSWWLGAQTHSEHTDETRQFLLTSKKLC